MQQDWQSVARAFSAQAEHYDAHDSANPVLQEWRRIIYKHIERFLLPHARILELNSGTGIDAVYFARKGHRVLATDIADGMLDKIRAKIEKYMLHECLSVRKCSYENLTEIGYEEPFDFIFSNLGGLNCLADLSVLRDPLQRLLKPGGKVTLVAMPPVCPWENLSILKGNGRAFRRLRPQQTDAHLEGYHFQTYYHSVSTITKALRPAFKRISVESLGIVSCPPSAASFISTYPRIHGVLTGLDQAIRGSFPFSRIGDHVVVDFLHNG